MLPLAELERLADRYVRDRNRRLAAPRAAEARERLDRATRALRAAADELAGLDPHAAAVAGVAPAEAHDLREAIEATATRFGAGALSVARMNPNGRRRLLDYTEPPAKFALVHRIADRLDELGVPLSSKDTGSLWGCAREALYLAGEEEPSRGLSKVVADVVAARKNRANGGGVRELMLAAE